MKTTALRAGRVVTISNAGTLHDGIVTLRNGKIEAVGSAADFGSLLSEMEITDYGDAVLMPGLVDCHSHLLEYAPATVYPATPETHGEAISALLLHALSTGLVAIGDHVCGFPGYPVPLDDCLRAAERATLRVKAALCSITLGGEPASNFTALHGNVPVSHETLLDPDVLKRLAEDSSFPGENVFITATPGNLPLSIMPHSGELVYTLSELRAVAEAYHRAGKRLGAHVGGAAGIDLALDAGIDVLHHAHEMTESQMERAASLGIPVVDTPLGGTHLPPSPPEQVERLVNAGVLVSIATDAYLPASEGLPGFEPDKLYGPEALMPAAAPALRRLYESGRDENACLRLLTKNPAAVLGLSGVIGEIAPGYEADLIVSSGLPALEITDPDCIRAVYRSGRRVIFRS